MSYQSTLGEPDKDYMFGLHFYEIAYGSLMEVYCHILTAMDVGYNISVDDYHEIKNHTRNIGAMLSGMRNACFKRMDEAAQRKHK